MSSLLLALVFLVLNIGGIAKPDGNSGAWLAQNYKGRRKNGFNSCMAQAITEVLQAKQGKNASLTELGAGTGSYSEFWHSKGFGVHCYDGNPFIGKLSHGLCSRLDLSVSQPQVHISDFVVSLEVAKHVPRPKEADFIGNLDKANRRGAVVTWAHPATPGRTSDYAAGLFTGMGYTLDQKATNFLRNAATCNGKDPSQPNAPWFEYNALVFDKNRIVAGAQSKDAASVSDTSVTIVVSFGVLSLMAVICGFGAGLYASRSFTRSGLTYCATSAGVTVIGAPE